MVSAQFVNSDLFRHETWTTDLLQLKMELHPNKATKSGKYRKSKMHLIPLIEPHIIVQPRLPSVFSKHLVFSWVKSSSKKSIFYKVLNISDTGVCENTVTKNTGNSKTLKYPLFTLVITCFLFATNTRHPGRVLYCLLPAQENSNFEVQLLLY